MASQLMNDGFFPTCIPRNEKLMGYAAPRLKPPKATNSQQLIGLSVAELSERSATIEAEINELGRILGGFLAGLVLLDLVIVLATW